MNWKKEKELVQKQNLSLLKGLVRDFNKKDEMRVGDWIKHKNGKFDRITHIHRDENNQPFVIQTGGDKFGQYHLGRSEVIMKGDVYISYSGGLDSGYEVPKTKFKKLSYERDGSVWIWRNGLAGAGNGVDYLVKFRIYEVV